MSTKLKVYSLTFNDDNATPYTEVFATERESVEFLFNYLEIDEPDRERLRKKMEEGDFEREDLIPWQKNNYDSYTLASHELKI